MENCVCDDDYYQDADENIVIKFFKRVAVNIRPIFFVLCIVEIIYGKFFNPYLYYIFFAFTIIGLFCFII